MSLLPPVLCLVLGDQLSLSLTALKTLDKEQDLVMLVEVWDEATYVQHHKKKIALIFSAMRHFAEELRAQGYRVRYVRLDDPANTGSFTTEIARAVIDLKPREIITTFPGEYRVLEDMNGWEAALGVPVTLYEDNRFLSTRREFAEWAAGRKTLRMEFFYRMMRRQYGLLMEGNEPVGGQWNFDKENRQAPPKTMTLAPRPVFEPDAITRDVLALVGKRFDGHFGDLEPFTLAVTRADARRAFDHFLEYHLRDYGTYQDAMMLDEPFLHHSHIAQYMNIGLLDPLECCRQAEIAFCDGLAPVNAVEGFIRQILGWREYVRGIYWLKMPAYKDMNYLDAQRTLPDFYWRGDSGMTCIDQTVTQTRQHAYAHHIQRLMVTGNFALLAGIHPDFVNEWYLIVYADAFEWVELPNVSGMVLFADGGYLASKPYAASGKYINRMSNYCASCRYDVTKTTGPDACPFNFLYWDFMMRHRDKLVKNHRLGMLYGNVDRMTPEAQQAIKDQARAFLDNIAPLRA